MADHLLVTCPRHLFVPRMDLHLQSHVCLHRVKVMYSHVNSKNGQRAPLIAEDVFGIVMQVSQTTCFCFGWAMVRMNSADIVKSHAVSISPDSVHPILV